MVGAVRPMLIGMNNPLSSMVGHELFPAPEGCTGHRLWVMLNEASGGRILRKQYLDRFERRNLVTGQTWSKTLGRQRASEITSEVFGTGRKIALFGKEVHRAFGFKIEGVDLTQIDAMGCTWWCVPHPSGRNLWYNVPENRAEVGRLMLELYNEKVG